MYYYQNSAQEEFFEKKRFSNENLPMWKDIEFIEKTKIYKELKINPGEKNEIVPLDVWEKLKPYLYFDEKKAKIETLRRQAVMKQPLILDYIQEGEIIPFEKFELDEYKENGDRKTLLEKTREINVSTYSSMYEFFAKGEHIGNCGRTAKFIGTAFRTPEFHTKGNAPFLAGTKNSENGMHAWLEARVGRFKYIIDTSMMLAIPIKLKKELGYRDDRQPMNLEDMIQYDDSDDMFWTHYNESINHSTKNKASYATFLEKVKELEIKYSKEEKIKKEKEEERER